MRSASNSVLLSDRVDERLGSLGAGGHDEAATSTTATPVERLTPSLRLHAGPEPVLVLPLPIPRPIGRLHDSHFTCEQYERAARRLECAFEVRRWSPEVAVELEKVSETHRRINRSWLQTFTVVRLPEMGISRVDVRLGFRLGSAPPAGRNDVLCRRPRRPRAHDSSRFTL